MPTTLRYSPYTSTPTSPPDPTLTYSPYTFSVNSIIQTIKSWFTPSPKVPVRILDKRVIEHGDDVIQATTKPDKDGYVRLRQSY
jgi:hypothetical protein